MQHLVGPRKNREYAAFEEGAAGAGAGGSGVAPPRSTAAAAVAAAGGGGGSSSSLSTGGGGGALGGGNVIGATWGGGEGGLLPFSHPYTGAAGGGGGPGGGTRGSLSISGSAGNKAGVGAGYPRPGRAMGGGSWVLPPDPPRRRLREALCCLRMSAVQALFLLGLLACLAYLSLDAWTQRRVLRLFYLTLEDLNPPTAALLTVGFAGLGLVFVTLGFPTTLLAVLGGHVYGRLLGGYLGVLVASIVTTLTAGLGCLCSFLLTKGMLRDCASERLHSRATLEGLDTALRQQGLKVNLLLRLCPLVPYNLMNFLMGLTATRVEDYAIGCFVGMLPTVILLSYFGAGLDTLEGVGDFPSSHRTEMTVIYGVGGGILLLTLLLLYRSTRRAMTESVKRKQSLVDSIGWEM